MRNRRASSHPTNTACQPCLQTVSAQVLSAATGPIFTFRRKKITPAPGGSSFYSSDTLATQVQKIFRKNHAQDTAIAVFMGSCRKPATSGRGSLQWSGGRCYRTTHTPIRKLRIAALAATAVRASEAMPQRRTPPLGWRNHTLRSVLKRTRLRLYGPHRPGSRAVKGSGCPPGTDLPQKKVPDANSSHPRRR